MKERMKLPDGWVEVPLEKISDVIMGQSPPSESYNIDGIGLPFFQGKAEFTELHPKVQKWCDWQGKIALPNDILVSVRAPVGATNMANLKCFIGRGLAAIRYPSSPMFLFYFFRLIKNELDKQGTGTTFRAISGDIIRNTLIPLPPLPEQHRIVAAIESLFSSLDRGIASLKTAQQQLKIYRQAVLKWAFEGKLTNEEVKDGELPEGWKWVQLGDLIEKPRYGTSKKCDYETSGIGVIRIPNIDNGFIDSSDMKYANFEAKEILDLQLKDGDILVIRSNGSVDLVGKSALITVREENFLFAGYLIRLRPIQTSVLPKFLLMIFTSRIIRSQIENKARSTSGVNNINSEELKKLQFYLPSLSEQHNIVAAIESRLSVCDKLEETILQSLQQAEALRQSILKKAFTGQLVPQDPNDEPASVLLERIRAERAASSPHKNHKNHKHHSQDQ